MMGRRRRKLRKRSVRKKLIKIGINEEASFIVRRELFKSVWAENSLLLKKKHKPVITQRYEAASSLRGQREKSIKKVTRTCNKILRRRHNKAKRLFKQVSSRIFQLALDERPIPGVIDLIKKPKRRCLKRRRIRRIKKIKTETQVDTISYLYPMTIMNEKIDEKPTTSRSKGKTKIRVKRKKPLLLFELEKFF